MGVLQKIRGLYRFDGDTEPVQVSRRQFFFASGVVLAGAALPVAAAPVVDNELFWAWRDGVWLCGGPLAAPTPWLVVTKVDRALGVVTVDAMIGMWDDPRADTGRADVPVRLGGAKPGDVLSPGELRRLEMCDARDYPPDERLLTITSGRPVVTNPEERHEGMARRAIRDLRRSGRAQ